MTTPAMQQRINKIPTSQENPIDVWILRLTSHVLPLFYATHHTPNIITTYSFLCGLMAVCCLANNRPWMFAGLYILGYVFDCIDGQYARQYGMTSVFGDIYDHVTDVIVYVLICVVVFRQKRHVLAQEAPYVLAVMFAAIYSLATNAGCQQVIHRSAEKATPKESLDALRFLCPCTDLVQHTKYFGYATFNLLLVGGVLYLYRRAHQK